MTRPDITLRPLNRQDFARLAQWINAPHVIPWWDGKADLNSVIAKYEPRLRNDSATKVFVIQIADRPVGMIQCYQQDRFRRIASGAFKTH